MLQDCEWAYGLLGRTAPAVAKKRSVFDCGWANPGRQPWKDAAAKSASPSKRGRPGLVARLSGRPRSRHARPRGTGSDYSFFEYHRKYPKCGYLTNIRFGNILSFMTRAAREQRLTSESQVVELIRQRRKAKGFSQQQLASKLGVTQARLSEIENGGAHLSVERLISVAALLGVELVLRETPPKQTGEW